MHAWQTGKQNGEKMGNIKKETWIIIAAIGAIGALTLTIGIAAAVVINVPSAGNETIQQAINNASAGDTILVELGRYNETLVINLSHLHLKANSTNPADTVVSANGTNDHVINITNQTTNVTIEGFTIQDARGTSQDVAGIYMDNTSACAISNTVIRNISAEGMYAAYGVMMNGTTIKPRLTDTTICDIASNRDAYGIYGYSLINGSFTDTNIRDIAGNRYADGIYINNGENVSFDPTVIERVNGSDSAAGIYVNYELINGSFTDTTIRDIAGNTTARGIYISRGENVSFDPTVIERVNASNRDAYGIHVYTYLINGSFTDTTICDIASNRDAYGIYGYSLINGSFTDTTIRDIAGNRYADGIYINNGENVSFDPTVIERVNGSDSAAGIYVNYELINGSFTDTTIRDIAGNTTARGIYISRGENVSFDPTVIERINASSHSAAGIYVFYYLINGSFSDTNIRDIAGNRYADGIYIYYGENVCFYETFIERVNASDWPYGIYGHIINGSFTDTTITEITSGSGTTSYGVYLFNSTGNVFFGGKIYSTGEPRIDYAVWLENCTHNTINESEIRDNGHGFWLNQSDNNTIERNMIVNNTALAISGVHLTSDSDNNELHENCFYYNGYWYLQALDNGSANNFDRNYWEPPPGPTEDPYFITGTANNSDHHPLTYCPLCAVEAFEVPALTPIGLIVLVSLLSAIAAVAIVRKRR
jgi:parallel beta-helix repeat protein